MPRRKRTEPFVRRRRQGEEPAANKPVGERLTKASDPAAFMGNSLPNHIKHAERVWVERTARATLEREGIKPLDDPIRQLQLVAAEILHLEGTSSQRWWKSFLPGLPRTLLGGNTSQLS